MVLNMTVYTITINGGNRKQKWRTTFVRHFTKFQNIYLKYLLLNLYYLSEYVIKKILTVFVTIKMSTKKKKQIIE